MPPFRPIVPRTTQCLRTPPCTQTRVPVRIRNNPHPIRSFASAAPGHQRPSRQYTRLAIASACIGSALFYYTTLSPNIHYLDAPPPTPSNYPTSPINITDPTKDENLIPTGTSTIPFFPRTIHLPHSPDSAPPTTTTATPTLPYGTGPPVSSSTQGEEYQLLGLGIRKVSFLRIQVYVVGLYIAKSDLPKLQEGLVRAFFTASASGNSVVSSATTLVENEKIELRELLLEGNGEKGVRGEKIWDEVLRGSGVKSVLRIVPTRATDFGHMREGWVRSVNSRSGPQGKAGILSEKEKLGLDESVNNFKAIFGGGKKGVGKGKVLLMRRGAEGELGVWAENEVPPPSTPEQKAAKNQDDGDNDNIAYLGGLKDERISRLVWLGYLAGGNVASDEARKSVVDGVMEIVERPIGTIDTQVI
ncbi:MAG: hypothetical protein Q9186_005953 [Xanthomendoza sp. 1 TL-2023]